MHTTQEDCFPYLLVGAGTFVLCASLVAFFYSFFMFLSSVAYTLMIYLIQLMNESYTHFSYTFSFTVETHTTDGQAWVCVCSLLCSKSMLLICTKSSLIHFHVCPLFVYTINVYHREISFAHTHTLRSYGKEVARAFLSCFFLFLFLLASTVSLFLSTVCLCFFCPVHVYTHIVLRLLEWTERSPHT